MQAAIDAVVRNVNGDVMVTSVQIVHTSPVDPTSKYIGWLVQYETGKKLHVAFVQNAGSEGAVLAWTKKLTAAD